MAARLKKTQKIQKMMHSSEESKQPPEPEQTVPLVTIADFIEKFVPFLQNLEIDRIENETHGND